MNTETKPKVESIFVLGRRWFQRGPGNTYHTTRIMVNGKTVGKTGKQYGYGDQYLYTALSWLEEQGYLKPNHYSNGGHEPLWQVAEREGFQFEYEVVDVPREKDL